MSDNSDPARKVSAHVERKLAVILSADVQGYSRLMDEAEEATLRTLQAYREVTDSLILSKISGLFVIARNSAFVYKGKAVDVGEIQRKLGVRYVLEGSVRKADNQVRITAQLADTATGGHLWSERYDRPLHEIFTLQDEIRKKIVTALKVKLTKEEQERFQRAPTDNLEAYDYYLRGLEYDWHFTKEANAQAR